MFDPQPPLLWRALDFVYLGPTPQILTLALLTDTLWGVDRTFAWTPPKSVPPSPRCPTASTNFSFIPAPAPAPTRYAC